MDRHAATKGTVKDKLKDHSERHGRKRRRTAVEAQGKGSALLTVIVVRVLAVCNVLVSDRVDLRSAGNSAQHTSSHKNTMAGILTWGPGGSARPLYQHTSLLNKKTSLVVERWMNRVVVRGWYVDFGVPRGAGSKQRWEHLEVRAHRDPGVLQRLHYRELCVVHTVLRQRGRHQHNAHRVQRPTWQAVRAAGRAQRRPAASPEDREDRRCISHEDSGNTRQRQRLNHARSGNRKANAGS